ncbi:MAG: serine/threonine-protein phosphatase [Phycisphaerales bacterium]|nr:MAG: serine/threonine-protein phosphatase [Phycisphaerales bacterium]
MAVEDQKPDRDFSFSWHGTTDAGRIRQENEDTFIVEPEIGLFVVSDGMGGHRGGALASKIVIDDLPVLIETGLGRLRTGSARAIRALLRESIPEQSRQLRLEGTSESGFKDMGATVVVALVQKARCFVANVGDSRAYRLRNGRLVQLTRDHSVVSELLEQGRIEPEEALNHAAQGQITRYMGMEKRAWPHVRSFGLKKGDRILLCTDGLTDMLDDTAIGAVLRRQSAPQAACETLLGSANNAGGHDNITVLVVDWLGQH